MPAFPTSPFGRGRFTSAARQDACRTGESTTRSAWVPPQSHARFSAELGSAASPVGPAQQLEGIVQTLFVPKDGQRRLAENAVGAEESHQEGQQDRAY